MWYSKEKMDEIKERRELFRQAVERRLSSGGPTVAPKKRKPKTVVAHRKELGYLGDEEKDELDGR